MIRFVCLLFYVYTLHLYVMSMSLYRYTSLYWYSLYIIYLDSALYMVLLRYMLYVYLFLRLWYCLCLCLCQCIFLCMVRVYRSRSLICVCLCKFIFICLVVYIYICVCYVLYVSMYGCMCFLRELLYVSVCVSACVSSSIYVIVQLLYIYCGCHFISLLSLYIAYDLFFMYVCILVYMSTYNEI